MARKVCELTANTVQTSVSIILTTDHHHNNARNSNEGEKEKDGKKKEMQISNLEMHPKSLISTLFWLLFLFLSASPDVVH